MNPAILFLLCAGGVFVVVVWILLRPLLKQTLPATHEAGTHDAAQKATLRETIAAMDAEHARGEIDAEQLQVRKRDLLLRARAEAESPVTTSSDSLAPAKRGVALSLAALVGVAAAATYLIYGQPEAMDPEKRKPVAPKAEVSPPQVVEMVKRLEAKLSVGPPKAEDIPGWKMLARSQMVMQEFGKAVASYRTLASLAPKDTEIETNLAEALLAQADGKPTDEIAKLLAQAYAREPKNQKVLWLSAAVAQEQGNKPKAVQFLKEARATLAPDSDEIKTIDRFIGELSK